MALGQASKGRIKQSVSRWCYGSVSLDQLCEEGKKMGLVGIDLLGEGDWETVKKHGSSAPWRRRSAPSRTAGTAWRTMTSSWPRRSA